MKLTRFLVVFVCIYQLANLFGKGFVPKSQWMLSQMVLRVEKTQFQIPWLTSWADAPAYFDYASKKVQGLGYVFRYAMGQIPDFIIEGKPSRGLEMTERQDIHTMTQSSCLGLSDNLGVMKELIAQMELEANARIVVLPVPSKLSIVRDRFPFRLPKSKLWEVGTVFGEEQSKELYQVVLGALPHAVDLYSAFVKSYSSGRNPFLVDESHWSSTGIRIAVEKVAERWGVPLPKFEVGDEIFDFHFAANMLQLPLWYLSKYQNSSERLYHIVEKRKGTGRIWLLGTSYCQRLLHTRYGLASYLVSALGGSVSSFCKVGNEVMGGFADLINSKSGIGVGDRVVWEVPMGMLCRKNDTQVRSRILARELINDATN